MEQKKSINIFLGLICAAISIIFFIVGLWPFNFTPKNGAELLKDTDGIRFNGLGIAYSDGAFQGPPSKDGSFTVEAVIKSPNPPYDHIGDIITFYNPEAAKAFSIGQWKTDLILRISKGNKKYKETGLDNVLPKGAQRFIAVSTGKEGTKVYLDGRLSAEFPRFAFPEAGRFLLVLGNSPDGEHHWAGDILGLAAYDNILNDSDVYRRYNELGGGYRYPEGLRPTAFYTFSEHGKGLSHNRAADRGHILVPPAFKALNKTFFSSPVEDFHSTFSYFKDVFINIFGFIPFGFFFPAYLYTLRKRIPKAAIYLIAMLLGFLISFAIEFTQAYIPTRSSSLTDLITNTLGTALGVAIFRLTLPFLISSKGLSD